MKTIGILTSGGDAPGMNAAVRAISRGCEHTKLIVRECIALAKVLEQQMVVYGREES